MLEQDHQNESIDPLSDVSGDETETDAGASKVRSQAWKDWFEKAKHPSSVTKTTALLMVVGVAVIAVVFLLYLADPDSSDDNTEKTTSHASDRKQCSDDLCWLGEDAVRVQTSRMADCAVLPDIHDPFLAPNFARSLCIQSAQLHMVGNALYLGDTTSEDSQRSAGNTLKDLGKEVCATLTDMLPRLGSVEGLDKAFEAAGCSYDLASYNADMSGHDVAAHDNMSEPDYWSPGTAGVTTTISPTTTAPDYLDEQMFSNDHDHADVEGDDHAHETSPVLIGGDFLPYHDFEADTDIGVGELAPDVQGFGFDHSEHWIVASDGQAKIIGFYAHWCPYCQEEVPRLLEWLNSNELPSNVDLIGVNTSVSPEAENYPPSAWFAREGWPADVRLILDSETNEIAEAYGLSAFPYTVVLNSEGRVLERVAGAVSADEWERLVELAASS